MIAIKAGKLIDGNGGEPIQDAVVLIENGRFTEVGSAAAVTIPPEAQVIDASGKTVMPGMIDGHVHVHGAGDTHSNTEMKLAQAAEFLETTALKAYAHAKKDLYAGFTTVVDMASPGHVAIALRNAINSGLIEGPRIKACGQGLCITGGHMDGSVWRPDVHFDGRTGVADSPWEFRRAARQQLKMGADFIKINICSSSHKDPRNPDEPYYEEMTPEEMQAVCDEARRSYKKVFAHSAGGKGITDGVLAGVNSLEHAHWITDEQADLIAEHGTYYVATFIVVTRTISGDPNASDYVKRAIEAKYASFERVLKAGGKIAMGTDAGFRVEHGTNAEELTEMVKAGMTPMQAIVATTKVGAERIDMEHEIGTIEAGKLADVIVVDGDPLQNIRVLENVDCIKTVIKGGKIVVQR